MKIRTIVCLSVIAFLTLCGCEGNRQKIYSSALKELDNLIYRQGHTERAMEARADSLKQEFLAAPDPISKYAVAKQIFDEYSRYDLQIAMEYAHLKEQCARESGNDELIFEATIDLADRYEVSGSFVAAQSVLSQIDTNHFSESQKFRFCQTMQRLYHSMYLTEQDPVRKRQYRQKSREYEGRISWVTDAGPLDNLITAAGTEISNGNHEEARRLLEEYLAANQSSNKEKATIHYWLAKTYRKNADTDNQILQYALSSQYDMRTPVKASRSMINLARLLYKAGDMDNAFNYLLVAYDDATQADANVALKEINSFLPQVINSYKDLKNRRVSTLVVFLVISAILILFLVILSLIINRDRIEIRKMQEKILQNNLHINDLNAKLERRIVQLKESNEIKTVYLGRYMSMFSEHIDSLERYRSKLRVVAKSLDMQEMQKAIRSDEFIEEERKALFTGFDTTFLALFPSFVEQLNDLLRDDCKVGQDLKPKTLSNELRIIALIRLGIADSGTIAKFLKKSPSTIYNYRVKLRNNARSNREDFDKQVMKIGNVG